MILNMEKYTEFLRQFEQISRMYIVGDTLEKLKKEYKDEIQSKRVLETIVDIRTLLKVFEKRGILQYDDISVLKYIAQQFVRDESINKLILDYNQWLKENFSQINNFYSSAIVPMAVPVKQTLEAPIGSEMPFYTSNVNVGMSVDPRFLNQMQYHTTLPPLNINKDNQLQDLIANKVGKKIGKFWRDVSRRLNIEESQIERIEKLYSQDEYESEKMFKKSLELYFSNHHQNWKIKLMKALELSRRKDLKELVEELILHHKF